MCSLWQTKETGLAQGWVVPGFIAVHDTMVNGKVHRIMGYGIGHSPAACKADGKEHGYGVKFWPIVVEARDEEESVVTVSPNGKDEKKGSGGEKSTEKRPTIEYDRYEGLWKEGWEDGVGKYTWYMLFIQIRYWRSPQDDTFSAGLMEVSIRETGSKASEVVKEFTGGLM